MHEYFLDTIIYLVSNVKVPCFVKQLKLRNLCVTYQVALDCMRVICDIDNNCFIGVSDYNTLVWNVLRLCC